MFSGIEKVYGEEGMTFKDKKKERVVKGYEHDKPFRPSNPPKKGQAECTLDKFPPYLDDEFKKRDPNYGQIRKINKDEEEDAKPSWKPTTNKRTTPMKSITTNFKNLRTEFPSMLVRR